MEVHHHSHHGHETKNWKRYFWEFFMLFLAVFCGSLAELQVEHYVEHQRASKYMFDLIEDIKQDTQYIRVEYDQTSKMLKGYDSLTKNLNASNVFNNASTLYRQYNTYNPILTPLLTDQAITQLRNSGNLRLINNGTIINKINEYWNWRNVVNKIAERVENRIDKSGEFTIQIFDRWQTDSSIINSEKINIGQTANDENIYVYPDNLKLLTNDRAIIKQLSNIRINISKSTRIYLWALLEMKKKALALLNVIEEEYKIK